MLLNARASNAYKTITSNHERRGKSKWKVKEI